MYSIRNINEEDYSTLCEYWKFWKFPPPSRDMLPKDLRYSIAIIYEGKIVCAGFLYATPSSFCWVEFIVSSPYIKDKKMRTDIITLQINSLISLAKKIGFKAIFSSIKHEGLIKHYKNCGFIEGSTNSTEMICKL